MGLFWSSKGQTSIEALLVVVIILVASVFIMSFYKDEILKNSALAVVRSDVDSALSSARLSGCDGDLDNITTSITGSSISYTVYLTDCGDYVNTTQVVEDIMVSLGCHETSLSCKGYSFEVNVV